MRKFLRIYSNFLGHVLVVAGLLSIVASFSSFLLVASNATSSVDREYAERFGLFVGLWAPTLLILALHVKLFLSKK